MKKFVSIIVALVLVMSMSVASAAVVSKTTTDTTQIISATPVDENVVDSKGFDIKVTGDAKAVKAEIASLYNFVVVNNQAAFNYFPVATREAIVAALSEGLEEGVLVEEIVVLEDMEINEFVTVMVVGYREEYGDVKAVIDFVTDYKPEQKTLLLFGLYTGELVDEQDKAEDIQGEYAVEWVVLNVETLDDSTVTVNIPQDVMLKMVEAKAIGMTVLSEKVVEEVAVIAE